MLRLIARVHLQKVNQAASRKKSHLLSKTYPNSCSATHSLLFLFLKSMKNRTPSSKIVELQFILDLPSSLLHLSTFKIEVTTTYNKFRANLRNREIFAKFSDLHLQYLFPDI